MFVSTLAWDWSREFVLSWEADTYTQDAQEFENFSNRLTYYKDKVGKCAYLAYVCAIDDFKEQWFYLLAPYGSGIREYIENLIAQNLQKKWVLEDPANAASQAAWEVLKDGEDFRKEHTEYISSPEIEEEIKEQAKPAIEQYDRHLQIAKPYGKEWQSYIVEALLFGLSYGGLYDDYGLARRQYESCKHYLNCYPFDPDNPMDGGGPPPLDTETADRDTAIVNAATKIKDVLMRNTYEVWKIYTQGKKGMDPISEYLDYPPTLEEVLLNTIREIEIFKDEIFKPHLEGKFSSWPTFLYDPKERQCMYNVSLTRFLDIRTAIPTLEELLEQMKTVDFLDYDIYTTLIPGPGFEYVTPELKSIYKTDVVSVDGESPVETYFNLSDYITLEGVRYYWDIEAYNEILGRKPSDETGEFIRE